MTDNGDRRLPTDDGEAGLRRGPTSQLRANVAEPTEIDAASRARRQVQIELGTLVRRELVVQIRHQRRFPVALISAENVAHNLLAAVPLLFNSRRRTVSP